MTHDEMTTSQEDVLLAEVRKLETSCEGAKRGPPSAAGQVTPRETERDAEIHKGQSSPTIHGSTHALGEDSKPSASSGLINMYAPGDHVPMSPSIVKEDNESAPHVNALKPPVLLAG